MGYGSSETKVGAPVAEGGLYQVRRDEGHLQPPVSRHTSTIVHQHTSNPTTPKPYYLAPHHKSLGMPELLGHRVGLHAAPPAPAQIVGEHPAPEAPEAEEHGHQHADDRAADEVRCLLAEPGAVRNLQVQQVAGDQ